MTSIWRLNSPALAFVFNLFDSEMKTYCLFLEPNPFVDAIIL